MTVPTSAYSGYSDLRQTLWQALRQAEEAYVQMRDAGASDDELKAGRRCQDAVAVAWRIAGSLADEV